MWITYSLESQTVGTRFHAATPPSSHSSFYWPSNCALTTSYTKRLRSSSQYWLRIFSKCVFEAYVPITAHDLLIAIYSKGQIYLSRRPWESSLDYGPMASIHVFHIHSFPYSGLLTFLQATVSFGPFAMHRTSPLPFTSSPCPIYDGLYSTLLSLELGSYYTVSLIPSPILDL